MALAQYDFTLDVGADWQKIVRLRDSASLQLVSLSSATMEIRNSNDILALRLDAASGRCLVLSDNASIQLHITAQDSYNYFAYGNYPGANQAVGIWGIGRSYVYDLFANYTTGVPDRIMRGFFYVDPNITKAPPAGIIIPPSGGGGGTTVQARFRQPTVSGSPYNFSHGLNTTQIIAQAYDAVTNDLVMVRIHIVDPNTIQFSVDRNSPNDLFITVMG